MRHHTVVARKGDGLFFYVSTHPRRGGYPCQGCDELCAHLTEDEAWEHHRQWVLDNLREQKIVDQMLRCESCGDFTDGGLAEPDGYALRILCPAHRTRDEVERLHHPPGSKDESWQS